MFEKFIKTLEETLWSIKALWDNQFEVIVSTETNDRSWESILQNGIDIKEYMKNPVILVNHEYEVEAIVWKALKVWTEWKVTKAIWVFSQTNPKAKLVQDLYNEWMLKAVSIWFIPTERKDWDTIVKSEMLEFSFVAVPCNSQALSTEWKQLMKKWLEAGLLKEEKQDFNIENIPANELKIWDMITFRRRIIEWSNEGFYPNINDLPMMWRIISKFENNEEILEIYENEIIIGKTENPVFIIQAYSKSVDGPKFMTSQIFTKASADLYIEKIITQKQLNKWFDQFELKVKEKEVEEILLKDIMKEIKELKSNFTDDKVKEEEILETKAKKEALQNVDRAIGEALKNIKFL